VLEAGDGVMRLLREAVQDSQPVTGYTHNYYRYPARFSPRFAATAIANFSEPGDLVVDPFVGGGTTVVEACVAGRRAVASDINSLATFITRVKTTRLTVGEASAIRAWLPEAVALATYRRPRVELADALPP
jgi:DNA modification methylase